jgi:phosphatidate phosphatase APP1
MYRILHGHARGVAHRVEGVWDRLHLGARRRLGLIGPALILPYRKFGTPERLRIGGRVIEDKGVVSAPRSNSTRENIRLTLKRYASNEIPGARVAFTVADEAGEVVTDEEGFFEVEIEPAVPVAPPPGETWVGVKLTLSEAPHVTEKPLTAMAEVLMPRPRARFGVISDIDDTIVKTGATNFLRHWRTVVANSAEDRVAFRGLAPFYRALRDGAGGEGNPIFYVSSSPWNLYDLFERFLVLHDIPLGPILLKDLGLDATKWLTGGHDGHKLEQIETVLSTYPQMPFILVGDSGQRDAEIYAAAASRHPGRIAAIYIRDVTPAERDKAAGAILAGLTGQGIRSAYGIDLMEAAEDAASAGWIAPDALTEIRAAIVDPDRRGA